ncbi:hypothetical protein [Yoonia sp. 208BN28-4]|uniref:hypothetical protein n=1 Tax=Yoonia sp. 208BN28-4 TaxID=3126505 RepID=UPI00309C1F9E
MILRSVPRPDAGWWRAIGAVLGGVFLPALLGVAFLYYSDAPLSGPPKDGLGRSLEMHALLVAAALAAAPLIAWLAAPLAVPALVYAQRHGWAGWGSAVLLAAAIGLPIVHFALNGDVTTEDQSVLGHIIAALIIQGTVGWFILQIRRATPQK